MHQALQNKVKLSKQCVPTDRLSACLRLCLNWHHGWFEGWRNRKFSNCSSSHSAVYCLSFFLLSFFERCAFLSNVLRFKECKIKSTNIEAHPPLMVEKRPKKEIKLNGDKVKTHLAISNRFAKESDLIK